MNIDDFRTKVLAATDVVRTAIDNIGERECYFPIKELYSSLKILSEFVDDDLNILVLKKNCLNSNGEAERYPLGMVCKNVWGKIEEIDLLVKPDFGECLRSITEQIVSEKRNSYAYQDISRLNSIVSDIAFRNLISAYKVLKHLDGHNKTLIILGPNGSGKTSFANHLKNLDAHVKVIPASKPIKVIGHIPSIYNSSLANYNEELYRGGVLNQDLLQKLIIGMCTEHDDIARKYMDTGEKEKTSTFEKVKEIFDAFFEVKLDNSAFSIKSMKAKKLDGIPFEFNNMSDGERVAFFYIATVVAAPSQSFIIVDEPENHLNPAIYNKIWEKLIEKRRDCQFIFISHTIEFISARSNYELAKIKSFVYPDKFEFDFLGDSLNNVQSELVVEILGSRKPILFCEGSKSDYDYRVYESLFGEKYTIVPAGNCVSVERSVDACNIHAATYSIQTAIGIVDSDLKSDAEIEFLRKKHIYTLSCNEIEMLLIDEEIFKTVLKRVFKQEALFESFKKSLFCKLEERKTHIVRRLVKTQVDERLRNSIIDDKSNKTKEDIKNNFSHIIETIDIDNLWQESESKLTSIISNQKYDEALRICCLEHGEIISGLGNTIVPDYAAIALGVLGEDDNLARVIRGKYFPNISI